jgi:soluble lytic murein transglycosylase-like protein
MKKRLFAGLLASAVLGAAFTIPAQASCRDHGNCADTRPQGKKKSARVLKQNKQSVAKTSMARSSRTVVQTKKRVHVTFGSRKLLPRKSRSMAALKVANPKASGNVVSMIQQMAPSAGVPAWFALRIARVESNYVPSLRGAAGEYGIFQIKCPTARSIGFSGNCSALLDARTNVRWGLKHLSLAINSSRGNLRLAASKHNGGLGRRTEVASYVAKVF